LGIYAQEANTTAPDRRFLGKALGPKPLQGCSPEPPLHKTFNQTEITEMNGNNNLSYQVAIIGAGPYGLAVAAHLLQAKIDTCVFGEPMEFWDNNMPEGMLLRSPWDASHIADPLRDATLNQYSVSEKSAVPKPIPLDRFVDYGRWFQKKLVPNLDRRRVTGIKAISNGFRLMLNDGDSIRASRVVVATGIGLFARRLSQFSGLPSTLVSHTSQHRNLSQFSGRRVAVVGSGQSALESAALLHELGADAEVIARHDKVYWLDQRFPWLKSKSNPLRSLLYTKADVGPPGLNWIVSTPGLFKKFPQSLQEKIAYRSIRPAGAAWLVSRMRDARITVGTTVGSAKPSGDQINLELSDGTSRRVDHVMLATGYQVDISRYEFLSSEILRGVRTVNGYPLLGPGLESSISGLHFVGAPAAHSFGPLCRFVAGTQFTARALSRWVLERNGSSARSSLPAIEEELDATASPIR
jgi:NADPH-dependent 2,4-dienoyl-CoA reductase/sulfur reductase-like enzyme